MQTADPGVPTTHRSLQPRKHLCGPLRDEPEPQVADSFLHAPVASVGGNAVRRAPTAHPHVQRTPRKPPLAAQGSTITMKPLDGS